MRKLLRGFDLVIDFLMIGCSIGFVTLAFAQVVCRFLLNSSLTWSEELCRYLVVEMVFLGAGVCILEKKHASVDIVVNLIPKGIRKYYQAFLDILVIITGGLIGIYGFKFACGAVGQTSPALRLPYQYVYMGIAVGGVVLIVDGIRAMYTTLTGKSTYHSYITPELNQKEEKIC